MTELILFALLLITPRPIQTEPARKLPATVSWVGNSFSGKDAWVLQDVEDIHVMADGTLLTNVFWEEAGGNVQQWKNGQLERVARHTHGWGYEGGKAIAANSKYVFIAQRVNNEGGGLKGNSWPAKGFDWSGVGRRLRSDVQKGAPFPGGRGKEGAVIPGSFLPVLEIADGKEGDITGLWATETRLYVSTTHNTLRIYDAETMQPVQTVTVERPGKITRDNTGNLWILQGPSEKGRPWRAARFAPGGKPLPQSITFSPGMVPTDICVDTSNRLVVADAGPDNQIKFYTDLDSKPRPDGTFGVRGGVFAAPVGQVGERRFNKPVGVGTDRQGNLYVVSGGSVGGGSTVIEAYAPTGKRLYVRYGLQFVDLPDFAPDALSDVYTKEERFTLDYKKAPGQEWSYRGYTVNPLKYPDDPRLHLESTNAQVRTIGGKRFLFVTGMTAEQLQVFRFNGAAGGETAIPCALFTRRRIERKDNYPPHQPPKGGWAWIDQNANGKIEAGEYVTLGDGGNAYAPDARGNLWRTRDDAAHCLPLAGTTPQGVPNWNFAGEKSYPLPADFDDVRRLHYLPAADTLLLGGDRGADKHQHWKPMGPVLARYENFTHGKPRRAALVTLPYEQGSSGHESVEPISFDVAGDYVFVAYTRGLKADGLKNAFVKVLRLSDLSVVGNLSAEAELGETGLLDLVESVRARKAPGGEYLVFLEDDFRAKSVLFRWKPNPTLAAK